MKICRPHPAFVDARSIPDLIIQFLAAVDLQRQAAERSPRWAPIVVGGLLPDDEGAYFVSNTFRTSVERMINNRTVVTAIELATIVSAIVGGLDDLEIATGSPHGNLKLSNVLVDRIGSNDSRVVVTDPVTATGATTAGDLYALGNVISQLVLFEPVVGDSGVLLPATATWNRLGTVGERWRLLCQRLVSPDRTSRLTKLSELFPLLPSVGINYDRRDSLARMKPAAAAVVETAVPISRPLTEIRDEQSIALEKTPWSTQIIAPAEAKPEVIKTTQPPVMAQPSAAVSEEKHVASIQAEIPEPRSDVTRGYAAARKKQFVEALAFFEKAVAARADDSAALVGRGYGHALIGHLVEATADFTTALSLDADCVIALLNRATVQAALENQSKAASDFLSASELAPTEPIARLGRAKYRLSMGDPATAAEEIAVAIKLLASDAKWTGLLLPNDLARTLRQEPAEPARETIGSIEAEVNPLIERRVLPASLLMLIFAVGGTAIIGRFPLETARILSTSSADGGPFLSAWQSIAENRPLEFCIGCAATFSAFGAMISLLAGLRLPRIACLPLLVSFWFVLPGMVTTNFRPSSKEPAELIHALLRILSVRTDPLDTIQKHVFDTLHGVLSWTHGSSILLALVLLGISISLLPCYLDRRWLPIVGALFGLFVGSIVNPIHWSDGWPAYLLFEMCWTLFGFALFTICFGWRRLPRI